MSPAPLRRFETILAFAAVFAIGWPVVFGVRPRRGIVAGVLSVALLAQLQLEGFRWQMIPLYLVAVGLAVGDIFFLERKLEWSSRLFRGILGTIGLLVAGALPFILPVPEIPAPSGPNPIGTITVDITDRSRTEIYGDRPGGPRRLVAQVWYPAETGADIAPVVWSEDWDVVAPAISRNLGLPSWFLDHTRYTLSNSMPGAPMAEGTYPVIVYSHGWQGVRTIALNQAEHLASNGYIVIAPDHSYVAAATVLGDGQVIDEDPDALPDPEEVGQTAYDEAATAMVETLSADIITVLDSLEEGETGPFAAISDGADLNRIGLYGHTAGGGAAIKACLDDEEQRCDAVLGMDPWVEPFTERDLRLTMTRPALFMRSEDWVDTANDALLLGIAGRGESVTYMLEVAGATDNDFVMAPLLSPLGAQLDLKGPIPPGHIVPIVDNYLLGFFDVYLLGTGPAALDSVTFPEVDVSVIDHS
jgi:acetyl esterase/lipase